MFSVQMVAARPYRVALAWRIASALSVKRPMVRTGPKISSSTMRIVGVTRPNMNGLRKFSGPSSRPPFRSRSAPSAMPEITYVNTSSRTDVEMIGPISTSVSKGPPILTRRARPTSISQNSSNMATSMRGRLPTVHTWSAMRVDDIEPTSTRAAESVS